MTSIMEQYKLNENQSFLLDLIRALTAQGVLVGHLLFWNGFLERDSYNWLFGLASYCVVIFFILSGLLISLSIKNKKNYSFKEFFIDRLSRIYTSYIPALVLIFLLDYLTSKYLNINFDILLYIKEFFGNALMLQEFPVFELLQNITGNTLFYLPYLGTGLPLWTLSIEWWLYMFFGYLVLVKNNNLTKVIILVLLGIVPFFQLFIGNHMEAGISIYWFLGAIVTFLIFNLKVNINNILYKNKYILLLLGSIGFVYSFYAGAIIFSFALFVCLKYLEKKQKVISEKIVRIVRFCSDFSFSLYLLHYTIITSLLVFFPALKKMNSFFSFFLLIFACNILSALFASITEKKHKAINNKLKKIIL